MKPQAQFQLFLLMFSALSGLSLFVLWNISAGTLSLQLAWPWLLVLLVSAIGIVVISRDLPK